MQFVISVFALQICDFGLARLEEPHESAIMTQEVRNNKANGLNLLLNTAKPHNSHHRDRG